MRFIGLIYAYKKGKSIIDIKNLCESLNVKYKNVAKYIQEADKILMQGKSSTSSSWKEMQLIDNMLKKIAAHFQKQMMKHEQEELLCVEDSVQMISAPRAELQASLQIAAKVRETLLQYLTSPKLASLKEGKSPKVFLTSLVYIVFSVFDTVKIHLTSHRTRVLISKERSSAN
jgi:hypothetical protein